MVCHCSRLASDSLVPSEKNWMSSGSRRPCTKLWATSPPWPWAQVLMLADARRGLSSNLKLSYQMALDREEDALLVPTWAVG